MKKVAIQGIKGSYHDEAAHQIMGGDIELVECLSFPLVAKALANHEADYAVIAIENSIAGSILPNYNMISHNNFHIVDEYYMPINHAFMIHPETTVSQISEVHSHPMAIMQCDEYFGQFPQYQLVECADTALAALRIKKNNWNHVGAIAPERSAEVYGLQIIDKSIQTIKNNFTRFFLLARESEETESFNKVSIQFTVSHQSGSLAQVLNQIAYKRINMSKLQSVPIIEEPMTYGFFADLLLADYSKWEEFLNDIKPLVKSIQVLGTYKNKKVL